MATTEAEALAQLTSLDDDLDSEDLDRLEDEADEEMMQEIAREDAADDLREHGMLECLRRHVVYTPSKVRRTANW